jgi:hypothetical protein
MTKILSNVILKFNGSLTMVCSNRSCASLMLSNRCSIDQSTPLDDHPSPNSEAYYKAVAARPLRRDYARHERQRVPGAFEFNALKGY